MAREWDRIRELFERAVELSGAERDAFLDEACQDPAQRAEVESMLRADALSARAPIEHVAPGVLLDDETPSMVGHTIGRYRIESLLGSGGMSTVFRAVQEQPRREIALKTMRFGLTTDTAKRRFGYEAEILARLRHPAIAQVHDAGTWKEPVSGQELPYFAMELVAGALPLDAFVRERRLVLSDALELFLAVCDGVQHGHQLGFVHRDLKPQNILVGEDGRPKIIDFGIARATDTDGQTRTVLTEAGQVLGTLQYMAPEQLDADPDAVDQRVDVYALGVVLYQLLAGELPFTGGPTSAHAVAERIRRDEPPAPSTLSGGFARSGFARDLDWIVRKAMAKARDERYGAVFELTADLRRFLDCEPVTAGPPSTAYKLRKFVRRNKIAVAGVAGVFLALVVGIAIATAQMLEARHQAARVEGVNAFYNILLGFADPIERRTLSSTAEVTMREALETAAAKLDAGELDDEIGDEPAVEADVRATIGQAFKSLGELEKAQHHLDRALALRREHLGERHVDVAEALNALAIVLDNRGEHERAAQSYREAIDIYRALDPDGLSMAQTVQNLAIASARLGQVDEAETLLHDAIDRYARLGPDQDNFRAVSIGVLGWLYVRKGDKPAAMASYREAIALYESSDKGWHPYAARVRRDLARLLRDAGELDEAEQLARKAVEFLEQQVGRDSDDTASAHQVLGSVLMWQRKPAEAEEHVRFALDYCRRKLGDGAGETLDRISEVAWILRELGRFDEAEKELLAGLGAIDDRDKSVVEASLGGPDGVSLRLRQTLRALVELYAAWDKPEEKAHHEARLRALK